MKVLIVGLPKSGTTALYTKFKEVLPQETQCLYEPRRFDGSALQHANVLAKILIGQAGDFEYASFRDFEHRILVVRDPRDHLVSRLLYRACADPVFRKDDAMVSGFVETLRQKERDPRSISLLGVLDNYNRLRNGGMLPQPVPGQRPRSWAIGSYELALDFHRDHGEFLIYKYEDLVAGRYGAVEQVLNVNLQLGEATVDAQYAHVTRTKGSGDWRNWFTEEDVEFFRPFMLPYLASYGYPDAWSLAVEPRIRPEHASEYIQRSVMQRRSDD